MFVVESPPTQISVQDHLFALQENGKIAVWDFNAPKSPQGIIELDAKDSASAGFISIHANQEGTSVNAAYGSLLRPVLEKLVFVDANGQIKSNFVISRYLQIENEPTKKVFKRKLLIP